MAEPLYPPVVEGTIPAFYGTTLVVPFSMNRAVSKADISGFSLKIKTIQTNTFIANVVSKDWDTTQAKFDISDINLTPGQYYKCQIAYIANDTYRTVGYYSTVGVVKYYGENSPLIYIEGLSNKKTNLYAGYYLGVFKHPDDPAENVAQYRFVITYSLTGEVFLDTGWQLHNTINDINSLASNDIFRYSDDLDPQDSYYIQYQVITANKMQCFSPKYNIVQKESVGTSLNLEFTATSDYDNGFVLLKLKSLGSAGENATLTGAFEISRQNLKNPRHWEVIDSFILQNEVATKVFWRDFTVSHGETYRYAIRQFNEAGVYTSRVLSNDVFIDFEDAYLFDGKRQLKIRYNPKVSSFKNDIPESKTDTIGSKYPFIFRNGHVNYKEFPISGLISYFSDEQELFLTNKEIGIIDTTDWSRSETEGEEVLPLNAKTTDLTNYNIAAERKFKLEVLDWLTNGEPKLFRSPTEGNYIVRLLNTSLTPNDTVGRMLHSFNCTAYEIAECNYDNLVNFGFIDNGLSADEKERGYYRTVPLGWQTHENDEYGYIPVITGNNPNYPEKDGYIELLTDPYGDGNRTLHAYAIYFDDMNSGDSIFINGEEHIIGNTGQFILEKAENINSVKIKANKAISYLHEDEYNSAVEQYQSDLEYYNGRLAFLSTEIEDKQTTYDSMSDAADAYVIANYHEEDYPDIVSLNGQIEEQQELINDYQTEKNSIDTNINDLNEDIQELEQSKPSINEITSQINANQQLINNKENQIGLNNQAITNKTEDKDLLDTEIANLEIEVNGVDPDDLNTDIDDLQTDIQEQQSLIDNAEQSIDKYYDAKDLIEELVNDINTQYELHVETWAEETYETITNLKIDREFALSDITTNRALVSELDNALRTSASNNGDDYSEIPHTLQEWQEGMSIRQLLIDDYNASILQWYEEIAEEASNDPRDDDAIMALYELIIQRRDIDLPAAQADLELYETYYEKYGNLYEQINDAQNLIVEKQDAVEAYETQLAQIASAYHNKYLECQSFFTETQRKHEGYNLIKPEEAVRIGNLPSTRDFDRVGGTSWSVPLPGPSYNLWANAPDWADEYSSVINNYKNTTIYISALENLEFVKSLQENIISTAESEIASLQSQKRNKEELLQKCITLQLDKIQVVILEAEIYVLREENNTLQHGDPEEDELGIDDLILINENLQETLENYEHIVEEIDAQITPIVESKRQEEEESARLNGLINEALETISSLSQQKEVLVKEAKDALLGELLEELEVLADYIQKLQEEFDTLQNGVIVEPNKNDYIYSDDYILTKDNFFKQNKEYYQKVENQEHRYSIYQVSESDRNRSPQDLGLYELNAQNYILDDYAGLFTYKYRDMYANSFDLISGQGLVDVPCHQIIGAKMDENVLDEIIDTRTELLNVLQIQADLKQLEDIYTWEDIPSFEEMTMEYDQFNNYFSFDRTKMPGSEDKGYSYGELTNEIFNPQKNSFYIYRIHPIFKHKDYGFDDDIPIGYIETLSPWEKEELRKQIVEMLARYNLTLRQIGDFIKYKNTDEKIIYQGEKKTIEEMIKIIKLTVDDFLLLEKYFGKEEFHYNTTGDDPYGSTPEVISIYRNGQWEFVPVQYFKNEGYYADATYYKVNQFSKTLDNYNWNSEYFNKNKIYYEKEEDIYNAIPNIEAYLRNYKALNPNVKEEDITPYRLGLFEKTAYKEFDKYHTFDGDNYYLIYKDGYYKVVNDYSARIYINTGVSEGVVEAKGELYTAEGKLLQPYLDLAETGSFKTDLIPEITDIYVGDGVILNLSYQTREIKYIVEETDEKLKVAKAAWENAIKDYTDYFYEKVPNVAEELYTFRDDDWKLNYQEMLSGSKYVDIGSDVLRQDRIKELEEDYLILLDEKIKRYKEGRGIE